MLMLAVLLFAKFSKNSMSKSILSQTNKYSTTNWAKKVVPTVFDCSEYQLDAFTSAWSDSLIIKARAVGAVIKNDVAVGEFFGSNNRNVQFKVLSVFAGSFIIPFNATCVAECVSKQDIEVNMSSSMFSVCPSFFDLNMYGYKSQAGALVNAETQMTGVIESHGMSHEEIKQLAKTSPEEVMDYSETYQYFAESVGQDAE